MKINNQHRVEAACLKPAFDFASLPWYPDAISYEQFRGDAEDAHLFFTTFDEWRGVAIKHEKEAEKRGVTTIRIRMSKRSFEQWCQQTGLRNNVAGRSAFAEDRACRLFS